MSIDSERRKAVKEAWNKERNMVLEGKGTRNWTKAEQKELIATGRVKGYYGHHKCSVKNNPSQAGNPDNIQFLTRKEHYKAHDGNYKNDPHGRYDTSTGKISKYKDDIKPEPKKELSDKLKASEIRAADTKFTEMMNEKNQKTSQKRIERAQEERIKAQKYKSEKTGAKSHKKDGKGLRAGRSRSSENKLITSNAENLHSQSKTLQKQRSKADAEAHKSTPSKSLQKQRTSASVQTTHTSQSQTLNHQHSESKSTSNGSTKGQSNGNGKGTANGTGHKH